MLHAKTFATSRIGMPIVAGTLAIVAGLILSLALPGYYVFLGTSAIVAAISLLGLGVVTGSAGMIALCQLSFAVIGAWVVSGLNFIKAPGDGVLWIVVGGLAAGVVGILVGLPALRLRGVNLAVVTLGFAAAMHLTLTKFQFPGSTTNVRVLKPELFSTDRSFFFLAVLFLVACGIVVYALQHSRVGSGWRSVAFSERGTASAGGSVRTTKLTAFAVSAALAGVSGGLVTLQVGIASPSTFAPLQSLALYVLAIVAGSYLIEMAVFGGILWVLIPELLKKFGVPQDWGFVVFGLLGIQALTTNSNLGQDLRNLWAKRVQKRTGTLAHGSLAHALGHPSAAIAPDASTGAPLLEVSNLSVSFGQVKALTDVSFTVAENSIMGLIGPNGAGKSTMIDALTGFLPQHTGTVTLAGESVTGQTPVRIARLGIRRTFQQDRVPPSLTIEAYVRFVARRSVSLAEIEQTLAFFGCPPARTHLRQVDVGTRRLVEVAAQIVAKPRILLLDEPAAGLSHDEHLAFAQRLLQVPARFGMSILLIEHDLDLVRTVCSTMTVLNFGEVLASGDQNDVLADPAVLKAYMGETEMI
ncbi:branched-chain amino acid ABC transporter ATP-binding protein/permease [Glaciibacter psychrotolerans]|uniref:Branched-chain amino acid transport system permease protein n=1 Tax=Glaciibacter psychrotolerans TaxID=670054 RepID=A0A7Z0J6X2_9MICO|nr:ATP-binding cassette domain-containing protein [Leifsonia psychrotolerans]NYJ20359.1 branched-chain amino acid transport system permease protein [Leifsonia psychrotolerans]